MQQTLTNELSNDQVRVSVQKKEACKVEFLVNVTNALIGKARLDAAKEVNKEVALPGFRKGKAPESLIVKKFPQEIERRFQKSLADLSFIEAQKLAQVPVLNKSSSVTFDLKKLDDSGATLLFVFETEPTPPTVDPKLFVAKPVERKEVGEKEVNEAIRQMAFFYAKWESIFDRPIQEGDFIMIDLDSDGKRVFDQVRFEVKPERMAEWMRKLVLNAKVGDVLEGLSEPDETATEEEKKEFLPKKVHITIRKVERAFLPEIDDEFAKKVGASDVAGMRNLVEGVLKKQIEDKANQDLREQVSHFLVTTYLFDLPDSLIRAEFQHRLAQMNQNPEFQKMSREEKEKIEARIRNETEQSLRLFYLSKQVVQDAKISITHQEVEQRAVEHHRYQAAAGENLSKEEYALAVSMVFLSKAQDYIINNA
ncbi:MAG TPA: trigger factor [Chlamydiales bacterium]|nr:trigger factor [Chlamydiales bacterium]